MPHPADRERDRARLRAELRRLQALPPLRQPGRLHAPTPAHRGGPSWALWALGGLVALALLLSSLATVYSRLPLPLE